MKKTVRAAACAVLFLVPSFGIAAATESDKGVSQQAQPQEDERLIDLRYIVDTAITGVGKVMSDMKTYAFEYPYTFVGVELEVTRMLEQLKAENRFASRVYVTKVVPNSSAERAGVRRLDVVLSVNGIACSGAEALSDECFAEAQSMIDAGDVKEYALVLQRGENQHTVTVKREPFGAEIREFYLKNEARWEKHYADLAAKLQKIKAELESRKTTLLDDQYEIYLQDIQNLNAEAFRPVEEYQEFINTVYGVK